ncbi:uncharacterized protein LOC127251976 isoform X2 [Andrographis paniculata]|uniref:uncharacterized protein LOC127251976 isoform X2 n=1 Tax=Andrographis paniculata TaxID=175694 RepID=UPI0021E721B8|nr:uncharacterized protein LOC127251976 isoform X2 [Andrographis paniculata]
MADPASTKLGRMLLDQITPAVMVLRTPLVEEACQKNGLSLVEMLEPFSEFKNIDVPVRTASDQPYRLRRFKLRFFYNSAIRQPNIEATKERLKQVITLAGDGDVSELGSGPLDIESLIASTEQGFVPSWFQKFNKELVDAVSFSEHEAFDHPVACLVAVSSNDKDPIDKFIDLFNPSQLPSLLNDGAMDPKIPKYFLLVHDNQDGMLEKATGIFTEMRNKYGANDCHLLCINSSDGGMNEHHENPWASYKNINSKDKQVGCFLNMDDIEELRNTIHDLSSKRIIPHMELKIRVLNQQVSATRKGFRNQIKNLWWRKGKDDVPENPNGSTYTFSSIESQIRVLGDYAFMLQDYELALSNYRLISTDYKLDKAWKRYAGVQEIMGLTYFMLDQSRKDAEYCMENAFSTYLKIGQFGWRNATRCGIWWAEMLKARNQFNDAAGVYFRISGEDPLHSAVMLEQASYCYLLSKPTMLRKYGFHLVLSGDLYKKSDQLKHAIRTYRGALLVFKGTAWSHIRDHVHFHIGKWYGFLGMFDEAIKNMLEVLVCVHQSRTTQELFLRDFFQIIQDTGKTFELLRLQLPAINFPLNKVVFEDHRTYASPAAASVKETMWQSLEEDLIPSLSVMKTNWLDSQSKTLPKKYKESNVCVAGEAIKVDISFKNPLQFPISVSNVSLICKHSAAYDETESGANGSLNDFQNEELRTVSTSGDSHSEGSLFTLSEVDIAMKGGETTLVQLTVTPKAEGTLEVVGVRWKLSNSVIGIHNFSPDAMKKKFPKGKKKAKQSGKDKLQFLVIKSLPRLEGAIHTFPKSVYAGDLRQLTLELKNPSKLSVKNLKMRISHPRFLNVADEDVMNSEFPSCLRKQENLSETCTQVDVAKAANSIFVFPETRAISWETPLKWPLWFRAAAAGSISLYIIIYYEIEDGSSVLPYRTLCMHYNFEVLPSLEVSFQTSPCPSKLQEFLVQMDVINRTTSESFQLRQLSSVGDQWELSMLQPMDSASSLEPLVAGQALSYFFKLKNRKTQGHIEDERSLSKSGMPDVRLDGDSRGFFDASSSPLVLFHHHERLHQEREEDHEGTVDFIFIYESQSDSDSGPPKTAELFSHHTCHCCIASKTPIWWKMDGPKSIRHDFSLALCEINLNMTVSNSSEDLISVRIITLDGPNAVSSLTSGTSNSGSEVGWHDTSHPSEIRVAADALGARAGRPHSIESVPPFIWSGTSSTRFNLELRSSVQVPLQICVFAPGTYDLSNYLLHWNFVSSNDGEDELGSKALSSGTCQGHSYHITVLQKE